MGRLPLVDTLGQDVRQALRLLRRRPGFACVATLTLAIGIGAATTIFSFVDAVLLRPLPYANADRLVRVLEQRPTGATSWISTPAYLEWTQSSAFERIAAYQQGLATMSGAGEPVSLRVGRVTARYFDVFAVRPLLGRTFVAEDDSPGRDAVVVLSHATWQTHFGGDTGIVGTSISLDGRGYRVIGVLPANSVFDRAAADIWYPLAFGPAQMVWNYRWLNGAFAVLRPGVSLAQARQQLNTIAEGLGNDHPDSNRGWHVAIDRYEDAIVGPQLRTSLLALMAAVGGLLLICCANLASLMLVRAINRDGEVALRAALGASRLRLVQQLIVESVIVTCGGGAAGVAIATVVFPRLAAVLPSGTLPSEATIQIDMRVPVFAVAVTLLTAIAVSLMPALRAGRASLRGTIEDSQRGSTASAGKGRLLNGLVVAEIATACVLLCGSLLLMRSFVNLTTADTGFSAENVLTMTLPVPGFPPGSGYRGPAEFQNYLRNIVSAVDGIPGVRRSAVTSALPLTDCCLYSLSLQVANRPLTDRANRGGGFFKVVTPSYFETLGLRLRRGRLLDERDGVGGVAAIVINERLAARYFPGTDPIGQHVLNPQIVPGRTERGPDVSWEIVGVVANEKTSALNDDTSGVAYASYQQSPVYFASLAVRTTLPPASVETAVRQTLHRLNASQATANVRTLEDVTSASAASGRIQTLVMAAFSAIAVLLAAIGIYGVLAYMVALRARDTGIRAALGASASRLFREVIVHGLAVTATGLAIGLVVAFGLTPLLGAVLYRVEPNNPYLLASAAGVLAVIGLLAAWIPARRAAHVDPLLALRGDS